MDRVNFLAELLSNLNPGTVIEDLEKQVLNMVINDTEDSVLKPVFQVHPLYQDSVELHDAIVVLRAGGSLVNLGFSGRNMLAYPLYAFIETNRGKIPEEARDYLAEKAKELKRLPGGCGVAI